jgi:hypothetical protein
MDKLRVVSLPGVLFRTGVSGYNTDHKEVLSPIVEVDWYDLVAVQGW